MRLNGHQKPNITSNVRTAIVKTLTIVKESERFVGVETDGRISRACTLWKHVFRIKTPKTKDTLIVFYIISNTLAVIERIGSKKKIITSTT